MRARPVTTPRIVSSGEHPGAALWVLLLILALLLAWQAFDYGRRRGGFDLAVHQQLEQQLRQRVAKLEGERDALRVREARYQRAAQIDRTAVSEVQTDLKNLQQERAELRQKVNLLKSLVSGDASSPKLVGMHLYRLGGGNRYRLEFSLSNRTLDGSRVTGTLGITVLGDLKGLGQSLSAQQLGIDAKQLQLGFLNFQKVEGELTLPDGYTPRGIRISVQPSGNKFKAFKQTFPWKPVPE